MSRKRRAVPAEVFVSHSSKNIAFVNRIVGVLAEHEVKSFLSKANIRGAQEWHDEIGAALERCDWFLLVLSPQAVESEWVKRELMFALEEKRYKGRILPVIYKTCEAKKLSWTLSAFQNVDFRKSFEAGSREMLAALGIQHASKPAGKRKR
ncbi:MAG: toll/interleukin-1 receptor domain-containing protein [Bryobacterales bacterium]|nr:toll/interleukin-1 receptor domain-containing protein [Bryobacterales bacterium]